MENAIGDRFHVFHVLLVGQKIAISLQCLIPGDQGVEEILKNAHKRVSITCYGRSHEIETFYAGKYWKMTCELWELTVSNSLCLLKLFWTPKNP